MIILALILQFNLKYLLFYILLANKIETYFQINYKYLSFYKIFIFYYKK